VVKGGAFFDPVGNYSPQFAGPVIRLQTITNLGWQQNVWSANLFHRYLSGYVDQNAVPAAHFNRVQDYSIFDLSVAYTGFRGLTLRAGILNLLDEDPPFSNQVGRFQARGYDDRFHNPLGRVYTLGASYQF
jgi:iron complex outermembrane receptor protein